LTQPASKSGASSPFPSVGKWGVTAIPQGWIYVAEFGIRQLMPDRRMVGANVTLGQDTVTTLDGFAEYIQTQAKLIVGHLSEAKTAGPQPMAFPGADEAYLFFVRHRPVGAPDMLHAQTYVRLGLWVGIITLTTPEAQLKAVRPDYDAFVNGLRITMQRGS
jgi:hypothetical protein